MSNRHSMGWSLILLGAVALGTGARGDTLGSAIEEQGGSRMLVNAGNAIQSTCKSLGAAGGANQVGSDAGQRQDLFFRCNEMVTTYGLGAPSNPSANSYGYLTDLNRSDAVRQFSGEEASSQRRLGKQGDNLQFAGIGARMDAIRQGARGAGSGIAMNLNGVNLLQSPASDAAPVVSQSGGAAGDEDADLGWAWFANMNVGYANHDRSPSEDGFDSDFYGGTLGVDYAFANGLVLGIAGGYQDYSADVDGGGAPTTANPVAPSAGGEINADSYTVSGYALLNSDVYFMSAIVSYGSADYDLTRKAFFAPGPNAQGRPAAPGFVIDRTYNGDTSSDQVGAELTVGADVISSGPWSVEGYAKLDYLSSQIDGYTEKERDNTNSTPTPGLALKYLSQDIDVTESGLGFTIRRTFNTGIGVLVPFLGAEWRYQWNGGAGVVKYSYAFALPALPGGDLNFASPTENSDKTYGTGTAGLSMQFAQSFSAFVQYEGLIGLNNTSGGVGTIGIRGTF